MTAGHARGSRGQGTNDGWRLSSATAGRVRGTAIDPFNPSELTVTTTNPPRPARRLPRMGAAVVIAMIVAACGSDGSDTAAEPVDDSGAAGVEGVEAPAVSGSAAAADPLYAWAQYGVGGLEARAIITEDADCGQVTVDGVQGVMAERAAPSDDFPVVSCAAAVDGAAGQVEVGTVTVPVPTGSPQKILVLGDSGCRMTDGWYENCDGTGTGTPWSFVAAATAAAAERPDLIVHVGDYVYREAKCDTSAQEGCADSPWGDNWPTWEADFFLPSAPLLDVAPWIVTRGNHEDCNRNHLGWLRFLDGRPITVDELTANGCPQFSAPYAVPFGDVDFLVLNTATDTSADTQAQYTADIAEAAGLITGGRATWTVTHRPFWGLAPDWRDPTELGTLDGTLQAAIAALPGGGWPDEVDMALAGHIHLLETLSFTDGRPHQVISGDAGTSQDAKITQAAIDANRQAFDELGLDPADFNSFHEFGYVLIEPAATGGWTVTVKDLAGDVLERYALR